MVACNIKHPDKLLLPHLPATWSIVLCLLPAWLDFDPPPTAAHFLFPLPFALSGISLSLCIFWPLHQMCLFHLSTSPLCCPMLSVLIPRLHLRLNLQLAT